MRKWLWEALCEVILNKAYSNLYLKDHLQELPPKDRALATRIFYGTLQNYEYCTYIWKQYAKMKVSPKLRVLLSMSVYQLLFLDKVPAYAVIDDAVKLSKRISRQSSGFVNAILRKVSDQIPALPQEEEERFALECSIPLWLYKMWKAQYGSDQARQCAKASLDVLPVYVRLNALKKPEEGLDEERFEHVDGDMYLYKGESLAADPLYKKGIISAMDPGSYAIAMYGDVKPGMKVLDVCAAPGTKTMAMAEKMNNEGEIEAFDLHEHRVRLIQNDARRLGIQIVQARQADSAKEPFEEKFDLVLCDGPCSGYGVLARKPDLKLHLNPNDMDSLIPLQKEILENASRGVKKDGRLVYSTCTINKKENEKQVDAFLKDHPDFELEKMQTLFPDERQDGFFMACLKRKEQ